MMVKIAAIFLDIEYYIPVSNIGTLESVEISYNEHL